MSLALTLGITVGLRRTLWMMLGELIGVTLVAIATVTSVASLMLLYPMAFTALKLLGGAYLFFLGVQLWFSKGKVSIQLDSTGGTNLTAKALAFQGFITAIANPKGWAFLIALLPPFIDQDKELLPQLIILISIMLALEFICLLAYTLGGKTLRALLLKEGSVAWLNRIAGLLMIAVAVWLMLD